MNRGRGQRAWRRMNAGAIAGKLDSGPPPTEPRPRGQLRPRQMNRNERAYALELVRRHFAGEIKHWAFEPEKLRLADNTFYTPDFRVMGVGGEIEFHETKGRKGDGYWCEEDAKKSIKLAAEQHPYRFLIVWQGRDGAWQREEI